MVKAKRLASAQSYERQAADYTDGFLVVSEAAALRVSARVGAPGGRALPLGLNYVCIRVIRAIRGRILFWR